MTKAENFHEGNQWAGGGGTASSATVEASPTSQPGGMFQHASVRHMGLTSSGHPRCDSTVRIGSPN
jgi:hypothetical protein